MRYLRKDGEKKDAFSDGHLAWMFAGGEGVHVNFAEALKYHKRAAVKRLAWAIADFAQMYNEGTAVTPSPADAVK
jgi:TPR repeat protein